MNPIIDLMNRYARYCMKNEAGPVEDFGGYYEDTILGQLIPTKVFELPNMTLRIDASHMWTDLDLTVNGRCESRGTTYKFRIIFPWNRPTELTDWTAHEDDIPIDNLDFVRPFLSVISDDIVELPDTKGAIE